MSSLSLTSSLEAIDQLKICIIGAAGVGKSALAVRLLTNRFITSYISSSPTLTSSRKLNIAATNGSASNPATPTRGGQQHQVQQQPQQQLHLTVRDVGAHDAEVDSHLSWAQCVVVVFARTDGESFRRAAELLSRARHLRPGAPTVLVANKNDLLQGGGNGVTTAVALEECHELALTHSCLFFELSVMESPVGVRLMLMALLSELLRGSGQQQNQGAKRGSSPCKVRMSSRRLWMRVFGVMTKSIMNTSNCQSA